MWHSQGGRLSRPPTQARGGKEGAFRVLQRSSVLHPSRTVALPGVQFDCEVTTPMFLAGADQQVPELRAPSIRGLLHWWFRAVAGGYCSNHINGRSHEQRLFGGAGNASGAASAVNVRVRATLDENNDVVDKHPVPHKDVFKFKGIKPGTPFGVTLTSSPYAQEPRALEAAEALFNLAATLGGLGRRSRRGFGAFQPENRLFEDTAAAEEHIKEVVLEAQEQVKAFIGVTRARNADDFINHPKPVAAYPILHDAVASVRVGEPAAWEPFIADLMSEIHTRKDSSASASNRLYSKVLGSGTPRQASTLLVSVVQSKDKQVMPVYTQFYCRTRENPSRSAFDAIKKLPGAVSSSVTSNLLQPAP